MEALFDLNNSDPVLLCKNKRSFYNFWRRFRSKMSDNNTFVFGAASNTPNSSNGFKKPPGLFASGPAPALFGGVPDPAPAFGGVPAPPLFASPGPIPASFASPAPAAAFAGVPAAAPVFGSPAPNNKPIPRVDDIDHVPPGSPDVEMASPPGAGVAGGGTPPMPSLATVPLTPRQLSTATPATATLTEMMAGVDLQSPQGKALTGEMKDYLQSSKKSRAQARSEYLSCMENMTKNMSQGMENITKNMGQEMSTLNKDMAQQLSQPWRSLSRRKTRSTKSGSCMLCLWMQRRRTRGGLKGFHSSNISWLYHHRTSPRFV